MAACSTTPRNSRERSESMNLERCQCQSPVTSSQSPVGTLTGNDWKLETGNWTLVLILR
jgi:hypothetical protein